MTFLIESLIACVLFTLFIFLMSRNPIKTIFNYPPAIIERCYWMGLVNESNRPGGAAFYAKKIVAMVVFGVLLGLLVRYVNGCETYICGALTAYALWVVVNWFDALASGFVTTSILSFQARRIWNMPTTTTGFISKERSSVCCLDSPLRWWLG